MRKLLLGTTNQGKLDELMDLLEGLGFDLYTPGELGLRLKVDEDGIDYAANAGLKASAFSSASGLWCLADDTGLEVDALDGAPGLRSARLVGPSSTDSQRRQRLLKMLEAHPRPWKARFRCVVALAGPDGEVDLAEGQCPGEIIPMERGEMGFGYDPIFLLENVGRTMAELELKEKNRHSHRAHAVQAILPILRLRMDLAS